MNKHWNYLKYVMRHKYFVAVECFREGLYLRGIIHDWHKFLPGEWFPYADFFYGPNGRNIRDKTGYYKPTDTGSKAFDRAWFRHQKRGSHHWQWWVMPEDMRGVKILPMDDDAIREMLCDWCGASRAQGHGGWESDTGVFAWYAANGNKMQFHPDTRKRVEQLLMKKGMRERDCWGGCDP